MTIANKFDINKFVKKREKGSIITGGLLNKRIGSGPYKGMTLKEAEMKRRKNERR